MTEENLATVNNPITRDQYLRIVHAALLAQEYRFTRQSLLKWLASYPGDLQAGLYYAQALIGENRFPQARSILEGLCLADPEFLEAVETLLFLDNLERGGKVHSSEGQEAASASATTARSALDIRTHIFALTGISPEQKTLDVWGSQLWAARLALQRQDWTQAEAMLRLALGRAMPIPLAAVVHLHYLALNPVLNLETKRNTAARYLRRWPDNLASMLYLADWSMESGDSHQAVALLHQAAARDINGQVARRLWGESHIYRSLWPEHPKLALDLAVPASVAAGLGWNRLPGGEAVSLTEEAEPPVQALEQGVSPAHVAASVNELMPGASLQEEPIICQMENACAELAWAITEAVESSSKAPPEEPAEDSKLSGEPAPPVSRKSESDLRSIGQELEHLAVRLRVPGISHLDGRFPVYIVFSLRAGLQVVYGAQVAETIESEMMRLALAVQKCRGWGARLFLADDPSCTEPLGIKPVKPGDPWGLKLALGDLDAALSARGERIGAVLIVGGPEIVPFHSLPNPVDDQDTDVLSDNPYATSDKNYFIPEWPVGRLPGGSGEDAGLLLQALRNCRVQHTARVRRSARSNRWFFGFFAWLKSWRCGRRASFGYTAAIWRKAASSVFRPIGKPASLHISPPLGIHPDRLKDPAASPAGNGVQVRNIPSPRGLLGYFNLHGLVDAAEWYGHRDPLEYVDRTAQDDDSLDGFDYPVALRPQDIGRGERLNGKNVPQVVFTEACYGLHIQGRAVEESVALKFLEAGAQAVVGSTCMAYGSLGSPLIAADLLGLSFWRFLQQGMPAGEALSQAKIYLASEMNNRQGYLDGEDQKTLISFVLYGDPLSQPLMDKRLPKSIRYQRRPLSELKTVCDRAITPEDGQPVPPVVMASVKQVVARYLPGMTDARLALTQERACCEGQGHTCPTSQLDRGNGHNKGQDTPCKSPGAGEARAKDNPNDGDAPARSLVTLSKQVQRSEGLHSHIARLTLDEDGKVVKLVVSR